MAAILTPHPARTPRPAFVVLEGGLAPARMARVYRRRRLGALLVGVVLLSVGLVAGRAALVAVTPQPPPAATGTVAVRPAATAGPVVVVRPGDTIWSVARRLQPEGDVRPLVDRLAAAHGPDSLQAGEAIPVAP